MAEYNVKNLVFSKDGNTYHINIASDKTDKVTGATNGNFAALDSNGNLTDSGKKASDFATLDDSGKVPSNQLPSYVDDVLEYNSFSAFPAEGESGKIYVAKDTNKSYRWGGSIYTELSSYAAATQSNAGLMSSTDKAKLDNIEAGATANTVSNSLTDTSATNALSAAQGKALNDKIVNILAALGLVYYNNGLYVNPD